MKIEVTDTRNEHDDAFIASQLGAYNAAFAVRDFKPLRVYARNADGSIIGGLLADTYWQYLEVHKLWVSEAYRNAGHASRLLKAAENEARLRGCKHVLVDTFSFQALGFYQKLGYSEFGQLDEFSGKHQRHYLHKRLDGGAR
ncbi:Acetyltransferase (GNAT) family protein [Paraburkholderia fungorum]|uniref:Acetyltransferase (GNAT) family protein n=1 Tax=Paraburkholderia fungorum TaxID=134537 RepID=A0A1H1IA58_9BURK|nr:GNAT family N-acetyltransferase [Paraburkholderia fungorum]SDR34532.1 Acetyltransferase (GNAT) family protein [Paraburkholderia fungorum]